MLRLQSWRKQNCVNSFVNKMQSLPSASNTYILMLANACNTYLWTTHLYAHYMFYSGFSPRHSYSLFAMQNKQLYYCHFCPYCSTIVCQLSVNSMTSATLWKYQTQIALVLRGVMFHQPAKLFWWIDHNDSQRTAGSYTVTIHIHRH